ALHYYIAIPRYILDAFIWGLRAIGDWFASTFNWVVSIGVSVLNFYLSIPGRVLNAFSWLAAGIRDAFRSAFNFVADAWNNTIGRLSWSVPGWVPGIGGNSISAPHLPHFHTGGIVAGLPGQEVIAVLQAGERVLPTSAAGAATTTRVVFAGNTDGALATAIMHLFRTGQISIQQVM